MPTIGPTFADAFDPKRNSFTFLRLVFATLVIWGHSYALGGYAPEPLSAFSQKQTYLGIIGVDCFFILSGFLITRSFTTSHSIGRFLWQRVLRIMPGYWWCLLLTAFVFSPVLYLSQYESLTGFLQTEPHGPIEYLRKNLWLTTRQASVCTLLDEVPYRGGWNGSLWSLAYEFRCYLGVGLLGVLGVFTRCRPVVLAVLGCWWTLFAMHVRGVDLSAVLPRALDDYYLFRLSMYFTAGTICFLYANRIPCRWWLFVLCSIIYFGTIYAGGHKIASSIVLPYMVFWLAFRLPLHCFDRIGDYSYGVYIYGFPVQQMLAFYGWHQNGVGWYFALSFLCTLPPAILSYHAVEKQFMKWKHIRLPIFNGGQLKDASPMGNCTPSPAHVQNAV